ncbi:DUF389 domain-containing protein [Calidifontibacter terrae]
MLVHVRLTVPEALAAPVLDLLIDNPTVTNLVRVQGASLEPAGDLIQVDVAREAASSLLQDLADLRLDKFGGIVVLPVTATPFLQAESIERAAAGDPDNAVLWDAIKEQAADGVRPTVSYHLFLLIAVLLASIAVITDSTVLVVGAMVVGPEFATVAAICTGLLFRKPRLVLDGAWLLLRGFVFAIAVTAVLAWCAVRVGWFDHATVVGPHPQTGFIWHPDKWSFVVALLAGAAGVLALSAEKSQTMVGVFISVTTVPAAGNLALALAVWAPGEIRGSLTQLGVNILGMLLAGTLTLVMQRVAWQRLDRRTEPLFARGR